MRKKVLLAALLAGACGRDRGGASGFMPEREAVAGSVETSADAPKLAAVAPELAAAQAVAPDGFEVTGDRPIRVDGAVTARFINAVRGNETLVMWVDAEYSPGSLLAVPNGRRIGMSGVVDLYRAAPLPGGYHAADVRTKGMKHPLLVIRIETAEDVTNDQELARSGSGRATGTRVTETLHLFDPRSNRSVFQHDIRLATGDGFGGFDVGGLSIDVSGKVVRLTGTRQDHLPARRARCMRPPPVALEFEWTGSGFVESSRRTEPTSLARGRGC